jgi:hypothetical protein
MGPSHVRGWAQLPPRRLGVVAPRTDVRSHALPKLLLDVGTRLLGVVPRPPEIDPLCQTIDVEAALQSPPLHVSPHFRDQAPLPGQGQSRSWGAWSCPKCPWPLSQEVILGAP